MEIILNREDIAKAITKYVKEEILGHSRCRGNDCKIVVTQGGSAKAKVTIEEKEDES